MIADVIRRHISGSVRLAVLFPDIRTCSMVDGVLRFGAHYGSRYLGHGLLGCDLLESFLRAIQKSITPQLPKPWSVARLTPYCDLLGSVTKRLGREDCCLSLG